MPFRYSYLAMKWPFTSFSFLRLLFALLINFDSFFPLFLHFIHTDISVLSFVLLFSLAFCGGDTFIFSVFTFRFLSPQSFIVSYFILRSGKRKEYMAAACTGNMLSSVFEPVLFFWLLFQVFDQTVSCQLLYEIHIYSLDTPICRDCFILTLRNSRKDYILCAHRLVENVFPHWKLRTKKIPFQNSIKYGTSVIIFLLFFFVRSVHNFFILPPLVCIYCFVII